MLLFRERRMLAYPAVEPLMPRDQLVIVTFKIQLAAILFENDFSG